MSRVTDKSPTVVEQRDLFGGTVSVITLYKSGRRVRANSLNGLSPARAARVVRDTVELEGAHRLADKLRSRR